MISEEMLLALRNLDHAGKLQAMQVLLSELAAENHTPLLPDVEYAIWTPYDSYEAAQTLMDFMEKRKEKSVFSWSI